MNLADVTKLVSKLRIKVQPKHRRLRNVDGPEGRLLKIRKTVTALIKYERLELNYYRADECRGYAERVSPKTTQTKTTCNCILFTLHLSHSLQLISDAIRHGDTHEETMEMANFYILEKQYVHKLFKVLVPRFENCPISYTRMYRAAKPYPGDNRDKAIMELRGNPFPSLMPDTSKNRNLIQNVLLDEAKKDYRRAKYAEMAEKLAPLTSENDPIENVDGGASEKTATVPEDVVPSNEHSKNESK